MGGLENNEAVTDYIWESLGTQNNSEHIVDTATPHIPTLHQTWMTPDDQDIQRSQDIDAEFTRQFNTLSIKPTHLGSPDLVHDIQGTQMDVIDSELIGKVFGHSTAENLFRPWWDRVEDVLIYALLMLGLIVVPTAMVMGSPLQCTFCNY